jgi:hypothetical protein
MKIGDYVLYEDKLWEVCEKVDIGWELTRDIVGRSGMPVMRTSRRVLEREVVPITKEVADIMGGV